MEYSIDNTIKLGYIHERQRHYLNKENQLADFEPVGYTITLIPDLQNFTFTGEVEISGKTDEPVKQIELNALELTVHKCLLIQPGNPLECAFEQDPGEERLVVRFPHSMTGHFMIKIDYTGSINDKMAGFYRSSYTINGQKQYVAVTQFEESDARRAFPCVDHPLKKAFFDIRLVIDKNLTAISNSMIEKEQDWGEGKKSVVFRRTPRMSTYLLFVGVGDFHMKIDEIDKRVRTAALPGNLRYSDYGLAFGRLALQYCERYFDTPYPLPKMDLIAIPDFAFGAMENWGAITFRENLLLHYPGITSKSGEERICEVIAHEIVHQWFGNLVTPSDWKYLWLNESFATYFGYGIVHHYHPEWGIWDQLLKDQTESALSRDGLRETFAIEIPGGDHVVINTSTAPIIYNKGGSILRQVHGYIGDDNFRSGLTHYLHKHAYGNTESRDLWQAFEDVSEKPIQKILKSWIEQPGYPVITAVRKGKSLLLEQRRFSYLPGMFSQIWDIPMSIAFFENGNHTKTEQILLSGKRTQVELEENISAYKINLDQTGFFRVRYKDKSDHKALGELVCSRALAPADRWGLQNDFYAFVRSGEESIGNYLNFLAYYAGEDDYLPLSSITGNLYQAFLLSPPTRRRDIAAIGKNLLEGCLDKIGYEPRPEESFTISLLRDRIIFPAAVFGSKKIRSFALEKYQDLLAHKPVHADILRSILLTAAFIGENKTLEWLKKEYASSSSEHERMNILAALGCFSDWKLIEQALEFALHEVPGRSSFVPIVMAAANPHVVGRLWEWYLDHIKNLERLHPMLYERIIAGIVPVAETAKASKVKRFMESYREKRPEMKDVISLSLERLDINLRMREKA